MTADLEGQVAGVAALDDPVRRSLYRFVARAPEPVGREEAAAAVGVRRTLAAFHLDKLAAEGLLDFEFRRLTGRTGPGAGRPAKVYMRSARQIDVSLPPREYDLAALVMAEAIEAAEATGQAVRTEVERVSLARGAQMGAEAAVRAGGRASKAKKRQALLEVLEDHGFEPRQEGNAIVLANCPFHALAQQFSALVCGMNLHLMRGARSALDIGGTKLQPRLEPQAGRCCVRFCDSGPSAGGS